MPGWVGPTPDFLSPLTKDVRETTLCQPIRPLTSTSNRSNPMNKPTEFKPSLPMHQITALVFVVLKLTHVIDWSWWWVLSPLWITAILVLMAKGGTALADVLDEKLKD